MEDWERILPWAFFDIRGIQEAKKGKVEREKNCTWVSKTGYCHPAKSGRITIGGTNWVM